MLPRSWKLTTWLVRTRPTPALSQMWALEDLEAKADQQKTSTPRLSRFNKEAGTPTNERRLGVLVALEPKLLLP